MTSSDQASVTAPAAALLWVAGVVKSYGELRALDRVDLALEPGEFVALLGLNGAGKTTLFQVLTGLYVPDEGEIVIDGADLSRDAVTALAALGIVFQEPTLDLDLPVRASLRFHAGLHGMDRRSADRRLAEETARLGLTDRLRDVARKLSGGNRRRVELARALMHDPKLLLLDEPTVGLDPATRHDLLDYVVRLCRERRLGVLWATHLIDEAERADRVVVLHHGRVVADAPPGEIVRESGMATLHEAFLDRIGVAPQDGDTETVS